MKEQIKEKVVALFDEILEDAPFEVGDATSAYFADTIEQMWDGLEYMYKLLMGNK